MLWTASPSCKTHATICHPWPLPPHGKYVYTSGSLFQLRYDKFSDAINFRIWLTICRLSHRSSFIAWCWCCVLMNKISRIHDVTVSSSRQSAWRDNHARENRSCARGLNRNYLIIPVSSRQHNHLRSFVTNFTQRLMRATHAGLVHLPSC